METRQLPGKMDLIKITKKEVGIFFSNSGSVTVEYILTCIYLFFVFMIFVVAIQVCIRHERLTLCAFSSGREEGLHNSPGATAALMNIEEGARFRNEGHQVTLEKNVWLPSALEDTFAPFKVISKSFPVFPEPIPKGDN